ncbi:PGAP1 [Bugula neritina]|uniref:GPI inositol-deacylase n=1 Tax=Bugula neritina TaxID=10212 RepID=A0A7J7KHN5_BUGNE|nr:PGAP1 [Bugula neritina]
MTYMFEKMQYIKQNMLPSARQKYPRYQLFAYGEGGQAEMFRDPSTPVQGVPVLFIPGNMGSYKQVRSLASVTYRMGHHRSLTTQFDFFSIDFNEEMYGFYGGNIRLQTEFLKDCILHVMSLYTNPRYKPTKVVLVGHSMVLYGIHSCMYASITMPNEKNK